MANDREELFSVRVAAGSRTYFFDVKRSREGFRYLVISETRRSESGTGYEHDRVMVFEEHSSAFTEAFAQAFAQLRNSPKPNPISNEASGGPTVMAEPLTTNTIHPTRRMT